MAAKKYFIFLTDKIFQTTQASLCEDHLMRAPVSPSSPCSLNIPGLPPPPSPTDLPHTKDIENHPATQVTPFLFLGNMTDASDTQTLAKLGIDHVLNVTAVNPTYPQSDSITYKQLLAADNGSQNIKQYFDEAFTFIDAARDCGGSVLIHCQAGVSRSPTIAIAYLIKNFPMRMVEAYKFIKCRRSIISPNLNFMGQLLEFEKLIKGDSSECGSETPVAADQVASDKTELNFDISSSGGGGSSSSSLPFLKLDPGVLEDKPSPGPSSWLDTKSGSEMSPGCSV